MRIKTKLYLGIGFLFAVILSLAGMGSYFLYRLGEESKAITKDNYISLLFVRDMTKALDKIEFIRNEQVFGIANDTSGFGDMERECAMAADTFDVSLKLQEANITEPGEKEFTADVRNGFTSLENLSQELRRRNYDGSFYIRQLNPVFKNIRNSLDNVYAVNDQALSQKNKRALKTGSLAVLAMTVISTISFLIAFTFLLTFPAFIANPISQLKESIRQITAKNYKYRLNYRSSDEFGEIANAFNFMTEKLDEYEHSNLAKLLFEKMRIETIINNMSDAIVGLDENKNILFANHTATELLGLGQNELTGRYAPDVAAVNDLMRNLVKDIMENGKKDTAAQPLKIVLNGKENYFNKDILEITTIPTGEKESRFIGYVIILKNITPFRDLDLAKTNFIATVSHELKTPISSIKMSTKLLEDSRVGKVNQEQRQLITNIKEETERLLNITVELLDLAQVETGNLQLDLQRVQPAKIVEYAYDAIKFQAEQKKVTLETDLPADLPVVNADAEKSAWVMVNLLSNAVRYTPDNGKVRIEARQVGDRVEFSVKDRGPGIDPKYKDRIFEKFFKIPGAVLSGTGLGLAISKDFIIAQGGSIRVDSELGKGSVFTFSLMAGKN